MIDINKIKATDAKVKAIISGEITTTTTTTIEIPTTSTTTTIPTVEETTTIPA
jgi:hypothetical protein